MIGFVIWMLVGYLIAWRFIPRHAEPMRVQLPGISTEGVHCLCVGPTVGHVFTENGGTPEECERTCRGSRATGNYVLGEHRHPDWRTKGDE